MYSLVQKGRGSGSRDIRPHLRSVVGWWSESSGKPCPDDWRRIKWLGAWTLSLARTYHIWPVGSSSVSSHVDKRWEVDSVILSSMRPSGKSPVDYLQMDWWDIDTQDILYSRWKSFWMARLIKNWRVFWNLLYEFCCQVLMTLCRNQGLGSV